MKRWDIKIVLRTGDNRWDGSLFFQVGEGGLRRLSAATGRRSTCFLHYVICFRHQAVVTEKC